ncbi:MULTISPECIES: rhamnan synthesis F family protein [Aeromicrobium]|uniref:rhamnan synthesis F family protein n=1 Tax=Aeromicrobium TaxID=2040 RepID=UPI00257B0ACF|nr:MULTISPECIES: rhamnan synthesis F family protein [Aeromicrobium]
MTADDLAALETMSERGRLQAETAAVAPFFDEAYYALSLPELPDTVTDLLEHFCTTGWKQLRKPNADFDVWWYWANHLDPAEETINPLVHYALVGRDAGLSTRPATTAAGPGAVLPTDRPVRRATLFAGFDTEGVVDEAALLLLRELARFSDVFCLFDGYLPDTELAKLREVAHDAWAIRHGAYDFGSYAMLASELVGWERLEQYDEVLFVNDSSYLVRPLDVVFERMDAQACDWWGLQATKGIAMTRDVPENGFPDPIPLDTVREELLDRFEESVTYDFLVGSYFLAFRRPVLDSPVFRKVVESVTAQRSKRLVIQKYEIGLTHLLIGHGHRFSTFMPHLYPFHPIFTPWAFHMIGEGFPVLKRFLLYQNHYDVPEISRWKERLLEVAPDAPVEVFEENLLRTAPDDLLQRSFSIHTGPDGEVVVPTPMTSRQFKKADTAAPRRPDRWVFVVDPATGELPDNSRAILDLVGDDPEIEKIVLTRSARLDVPGRNVTRLPQRSPQGREALLGAGVILVKERPYRTLGLAGLPERHVVVAVREGLSLSATARMLKPADHPGDVHPSDTGPLEMLHQIPRQAISGVLTASAVDRSATLAAHWPARFTEAWLTGIPAHDHLVAEMPPAEVAAQEQGVRDLLRGRRLVLLATTRRSSTGSAKPYPYSPSEIDALVTWAESNDAVWGIRDPRGDLERAYLQRFAGSALDLSAHRFPRTQAVLRATDLLVTDHDGIGLDFMATGRPVVSFAHDLDDVADSLLFDLEHLFPGPVCRDFDSFHAALSQALDSTAPWRRYLRTRDLLIDHLDGRSTERAVERIRLELEGGAA